MVGVCDIELETVMAFEMVEPTGPIWEAMLVEKNWLVWRREERAGQKPRKVPCTAKGNNAAAKNAARWDFDEALDHAEDLGDEYGIGYLPRAGSAAVVIDADGAIIDGRDLDTDMVPENWETQTYCEISASQTGAHFLVARDDEILTGHYDSGDSVWGWSACDSRFFALTLDCFDENSREIRAVPELLQYVTDSRQIEETKAPEPTPTV